MNTSYSNSTKDTPPLARTFLGQNIFHDSSIDEHLDDVPVIPQEDKLLHDVPQRLVAEQPRFWPTSGLHFDAKSVELKTDFKGARRLIQGTDLG